ncbi:MAG: hypothetical protein KAW61_02550, partial [candidate division Zixibacteria bacterium]|nr:hypothetical protein [candidate division Zixibacteria bacterium]
MAINIISANITDKMTLFMALPLVKTGLLAHEQEEAASQWSQTKNWPWVILTRTGQVLSTPFQSYSCRSNSLEPDGWVAWSNLFGHGQK